jgi:hypothetical protein
MHRLCGTEQERTIVRVYQDARAAESGKLTLRLTTCVQADCIRRPIALGSGKNSWYF